MSAVRCDCSIQNCNTFQYTWLSLLHFSSLPTSSSISQRHVRSLYSLLSRTLHDIVNRVAPHAALDLLHDGHERSGGEKL